MSGLEILRWPDPRLSQVCAPVGAVTSDVVTLSQKMLETMYAAPGRGLAAPQVGEMLRLFVMDTTWKEGAPTPMVFIDPAIVARSEIAAENTEGCLSIPGVSAQVTRPEWVELAWTTLEGLREQRRFDGFAAVCAQHELDHLDGIVTFDRLDPEARADAERAYADHAA